MWREFEGLNDGVNLFDVRLGCLRCEGATEHKAIPVDVEDVDDRPAVITEREVVVPAHVDPDLERAVDAISALGSVQARRSADLDAFAGHGSRRNIANDDVGASLGLKRSDEVVDAVADRLGARPNTHPNRRC